MKKSSESTSEVGVKDSVDDWIEGTVDVAEPDERRHDIGVHLTRASTLVPAGRVTGRRVAHADGVDDVDCEERSPAQQEHRYNHHQTYRLHSAVKPPFAIFDIRAL